MCLFAFCCSAACNNPSVNFVDTSPYTGEAVKWVCAYNYAKRAVPDWRSPLLLIKYFNGGDEICGMLLFLQVPAF